MTGTARATAHRRGAAHAARARSALPAFTAQAGLCRCMAVGPHCCASACQGLRQPKRVAARMSTQGAAARTCTAGGQYPGRRCAPPRGPARSGAPPQSGAARAARCIPAPGPPARAPAPALQAKVALPLRSALHQPCTCLRSDSTRFCACAAGQWSPGCITDPPTLDPTQGPPARAPAPALHASRCIAAQDTAGCPLTSRPLLAGAARALQTRWPARQVTQTNACLPWFSAFGCAPMHPGDSAHARKAAPGFCRRLWGQSAARTRWAGSRRPCHAGARAAAAESAHVGVQCQGSGRLSMAALPAGSPAT